MNNKLWPILVVFAFVLGTFAGNIGTRYQITKALEKADFQPLCDIQNPFLSPYGGRLWTGKDGMVLSCYNTHKYMLVPTPSNSDWIRKERP